MSDVHMHRPSLSRRLVAEFVGTALLVAAVVGSGIMGDRLAGGNAAIALLANTIARAFTDTFAGIRPADVPLFVLAQGIGATGATLLFRWLLPTLPATAGRVVVRHGTAAQQG